MKMNTIVNNVDNYVAEIKEFLKKADNSPFTLYLIFEGLNTVISSINSISKYIPNKDTDLALEKLYTLVTIIEIKIEEIEDRIWK